MNTSYYLIKYYEIYGPFRVAFCHRKTKYWYHCKFPSEEFNKRIKLKGETIHRIIMHDEIVIETDLTSWYDNKIINEGVVDKCLSEMWSFKSWTSGNKSFHTQLFFPQLNNIKSPYKLKIAKEHFIKWFFDNNVEDLKVDLGLCGNHLIRAEYQLHEKTKRNKIPIVEHETDEPNKLPIDVLKSYNKEIQSINSYKYTIKTNIRMPCITKLTSISLQDGKKRVLFILASHFKSTMDKFKLISFLNNWSMSRQQGALSYGLIQSIAYNQYKTKMKPGCRYVKTVLEDIGLKYMCYGCNYHG